MWKASPDLLLLVAANASCAVKPEEAFVSMGCNAGSGRCRLGGAPPASDGAGAVESSGGLPMMLPYLCNWLPVLSPERVLVMLIGAVSLRSPVFASAGKRTAFRAASPP